MPEKEIETIVATRVDRAFFIFYPPSTKGVMKSNPNLILSIIFLKV
jgi:hypothetical protein